MLCILVQRVVKLSHYLTPGWCSKQSTEGTEFKKTPTGKLDPALTYRFSWHMLLNSLIPTPLPTPNPPLRWGLVFHHGCGSLRSQRQLMQFICVSLRWALRTFSDTGFTFRPWLSYLNKGRRPCQNLRTSSLILQVVSNVISFAYPKSS